MKTVLLLGDSIRVGYDKSVKKTLEGAVNVYFPKENCRFAAYLLRNVHTYQKLIPNGNEVDLVHWNAGLWDCLRCFGEEPQSPIDIYSYYIDRLCIRMKKVFPKASFVFATSTRVQSELMSPNFMRYNEDIERYNEAAVSIVKKYGFGVNDLYAVSAALPLDAHSDKVHYYTSMGTEAFTKAVVSHILAPLGIKDEFEYKEELYTGQIVGI